MENLYGSFTDFVLAQPYGYMSELARETKIGKNTISLIFSGKRKPCARTAAVLSKATGLTIAQINASFSGKNKQ